MTDNQLKPNQYGGLKRIVLATINSFKGFAWMLKHEAAFRQEIILCCGLTISTFWFDVSGAERVTLVVSLLVVILVEIINTAIETVVDRIGLERHALSGLAKDLGSSAVFISIVIAGIVWFYILLTP